jgi:anti-anti-sigma factor
MEIRERHSGGVAFLVLSGDLLEDSSYDHKGLLKQVDRLIRNGEDLVVLDLTDVQRIDALGLGEIAESIRHASSRGACLKLLRPQPRVEGLLSVTRLRAVVDVYDDEDQIVRHPVAARRP